MEDVMGGAPQSAPFDIVARSIRRRTLRRQQKKAIINDLLQDIITIEQLVDSARNDKQRKGYENLYEIVYGAYIELLDSEV